MVTRSAIALAAEMCVVLKEKQLEAVDRLLLLFHVLNSLAHTGVAAGHKRGKGTDGRYHSIQGCIRSAAVRHLQQPLHIMHFFPSPPTTQVSSFHHRSVPGTVII